MSETISQLASASGANASDIFPATQGSSGPGTGTTRGVTLTQILAGVLPLAGGTMTGGLTISAGGAAITGNSSYTGTLTTSGAFTVSSGGAAITGATAITGALTASTGLTATAGGVTVSAGGAVVTGNSSITGTLDVSNNLTDAAGGAFGPLSTLSAGSGFLVAESTGGLTAAYFMNSHNAAGATAQIIRADRTDGVMLQTQFGASTVTGTITTNGTNTAYGTTSDQRLKVHIGEIAFSEAAHVIEKLCARWYTWIAFPDRDPEPGFFAQQVYKVYPWAVTKGRGAPGSKRFRPWQIDMAKFMPVLVATMQGLLRDNRDFARRIADLESETKRGGIDPRMPLSAMS